MYFYKVLKVVLGGLIEHVFMLECKNHMFDIVVAPLFPVSQ